MWCAEITIPMITEGPGAESLRVALHKSELFTFTYVRQENDSYVPEILRTAISTNTYIRRSLTSSP